ncbi:GNAT family N-acetyltransferase [Paenibacillus sp. P26]|nr:GNAT family N-acetyltransferase [Paenibacillus sp. P26]UUZ89995.1 GNAT family N-acetyltransferase [Paenibacillus sp. P25]
MDADHATNRVLHIRNIKDHEIVQVSLILEEAALWLKNMGRAMWNESQYSVNGIVSHYRIDDIYLGFVEDEAAVAMILQEEDPLLWPDVETGQSLFLHKLAVKRKHAKQGISGGMIGWAKELARSLGKSYLRLDCASDRPSLCGFYEKHGFVRVKNLLVLNKYPTALYEFPIP